MTLEAVQPGNTKALNISAKARFKGGFNEYHFTVNLSAALVEEIINIV